MNILGVVAHTLGYGDACAALSLDGKVTGVIEEERFSRLRYDDSFPGRAIDWLLQDAGIRGSDIDIAALHLHPWKGLSNRLFWVARHPWDTTKNAGKYLEYYRRYDNLKDELETHLSTKSLRLEYHDHHLCHAAVGFYTSPFDRAAFLSLDGTGEGVTGSLGVGSKEDGVRIKERIPYPHSLGLAYSAVCDFLGFPPPAGPGKIMGLAPYGDPTRFLPLLRKLIRIEAGTLRLDLTYFLFHRNLATPLSPRPWLSPRFGREVGGLRRDPQASIEEIHKDIAAALQQRTNEVGIELARYVANSTGETRLCLGGGVALNSVMNGAILADGAFEHVHIQPAAGDAGNALGAVMLTALAHGQSVPTFAGMPYTGPQYSDAEIKAELDVQGLAYTHSPHISSDAARAIKDGMIVGWFQGRMEYGPRALGCRSILADPQRPDMKDVINQRVKHREWFRPFAPSVTAEAHEQYFTGPVDNPYMLIVASVREKWREVFPSITHVDGTARVQSVSQELNPLFHDLLTCLGEIHTHPVVLNTSFNTRSPIVCTPKDAIECFLETEIDVLCIGNYLILKKAAPTE